MLLMTKLLTAAALLAGCGAGLARAQSGVRPAPAANDAQQESPEQRPAADDDAAKAEQACEQARAHAARGAEGAQAAREAFARGVKLYLRVYTKERPRVRDAAVQAAFREQMRGRLKGAPRCVEDYLALGRVTPFEREQLEAFGGQVSMLIAADEARAVVIGAEADAPARIKDKPAPGFTEEARRNDVRGRVRLRAVLASDGSVKHVLVLEGLPFGISEMCVAAAKRIRFTPAVKNGRPVSQFVMLEYNFNTY